MGQYLRQGYQHCKMSESPGFGKENGYVDREDMRRGDCGEGV